MAVDVVGFDAVVLPPPHPFLGGTQPATDHSLSYEAQAPPLLFGAEADAASFRRQAQAVMAQQRREEALLEEAVSSSAVLAERVARLEDELAAKGRELEAERSKVCQL